jgi:retron-type reverse transcriptase
MFRQPGCVGAHRESGATIASLARQWAQGVSCALSFERQKSMGFFDFFRKIFGPAAPKLRKPNLVPPDPGLGPGELARRLGVSVDVLKSVPLDYEHFTISKRKRGTRQISAPNERLKQTQRLILRRLLDRLNSHPAAVGFQKRQSIATNALYHVGAEVVLRMDIVHFFASTTSDRVRAYFYGIGWGQEAADILLPLCTYQQSLPQGAPTSPRLSNLVNYEVDARLDGWARKVGANYSRYADDLTFSFTNLQAPPVSSFAQNPKTLEPVSKLLQDHDLVAVTIRMTKKILAEYGYKLHQKRKLNIRRRHQQQRVTGLVVNDKVALPRQRRRWLRAVQHHMETGLPATLTADQLAGWRALENMIHTQTQPE